jgi:hypothetical protein
MIKNLKHTVIHPFNHTRSIVRMSMCLYGCMPPHSKLELKLELELKPELELELIQRFC